MQMRIIYFRERIPNMKNTNMKPITILLFVIIAVMAMTLPAIARSSMD